jgi:hypothetical protein
VCYLCIVHKDEIDFCIFRHLFIVGKAATLWGNYLWREVITQAKQETNGFQTAEQVIVSNSFIHFIKNEAIGGNSQCNKNSLQSIPEEPVFEYIDEQSTNDENDQTSDVLVVKEV